MMRDDPRKLQNDELFVGVLQLDAMLRFEVYISYGEFFLTEEEGPANKYSSLLLFVGDTALVDRIGAHFEKVELEGTEGIWNFAHPHQQRGRISEIHEKLETIWEDILMTAKTISLFASDPDKYEQTPESQQ